jgi:CheY-like chemotaxis protein
MNGLRVLLLDNNEEALRLATDMLTANGYTVYACATCEQAGRMVALVRPRVILFHGCDGDEQVAFNTLLQHAPHVPVVHFSAQHNSYEVYNAANRKRGYARAAERYALLPDAIRAALVQALQAY